MGLELKAEIAAEKAQRAAKWIWRTCFAAIQDQLENEKSSFALSLKRHLPMLPG